MAKLLDGTRIYGTGTIDTILYVNGSTPATSTATGALQLVGGLGAWSNAFIGGNLNVTGQTTVTNTTIATTTQTGALRVYGGIGVGGALFLGSTATIGSSNRTNASSTNTGVLVAQGGAGVWNNLFIGGNTNIAGVTTVTNATAATSTQTGALRVYGGIGVGGISYIQDLNIIASDNATSTTTGALTVSGGAGIGQDLWVGGLITATSLTLTSSATSFSTNTGALQVQGGAGIGGSLFVGGAFTVSSRVSVFGSATNPLAGAAQPSTVVISGGISGGAGFLGDLVLYNGGMYSQGPSYFSQGININGAISIGTIGAVGDAGTLLQANGGSSAPSWVSALTVSSISLSSTATSTSTTTGALIVTGGVGVGGNLNIGGNIVVGAGTTGTNTTGTIITPQTELTLGQTGDTFGATYLRMQNRTGLNGALFDASSSTQALVDFGFKTANAQRNIRFETRGGINNFITGGDGFEFQIGSPAAPTLVTNNIQTLINVLTNSTSTNTGALLVKGGAGIWNNLFVGGNDTVAGTSTVTNTTNATTTQSGALVVTGGAGIGNNLYVGNNINILGSASANSTNTGALRVFGGIGTNDNLYVNGTTTLVGQSTVTNFTAATSTSTGALQVRGGVGVGGALFVQNAATIGFNGTNATSTNTGVIIAQGGAGIWNNLFVGGNSTIAGATTVTNTTNATTTQSGALVVTGGAGIGNNLYVGGSANILSTLASTTTVSSNALYVAGGAGIATSLYVTGPTVFSNNVTFLGTTTNVVSTNTVYTDNILELHFTSTWTVNDSRDVGLRFHYYDTADRNGFLGYKNTSGYLEYFADSTETAPGGVVTPSIYGTFRTGNFIANSGTNATSTNTGALQVFGGVGINQNIYVGGTTTLVGQSTVTNTTNATSTSTGALVVAGGVGVKNDLYLGGIATVGALTRTDASTTNTGVLIAQGGLGVWNSAQIGGITTIGSSNGTNATTTNTGVLVAQGGLGVWNNLQVGGTTTLVGQSTVTNFTAATNTSTGALQVRGGVGVGGSLYAAAVFDQGNRVVTAVTPSTGVGIGITSITSVGTATAFTIANYGVTALAGSTYIGVSASTGSLTVTNLGVQTLTAGTDTVVSSSTGTITVWNASTLQTITNRGFTTTNQVVVNNFTQATTTNTGALVVTGGVGIGGALYVANTATILSTTSATSTTTGALIVQGGVGIAGNLAIGGAVYAQGTTGTVSQFLESTSVGVRWTTLGSTFNGGLAHNPVIIDSNQAAISTNTGDLQVLGGIGVNGSIYVKGTVFTNGTQILPTTSQEFSASAGQTSFTVAGGYSVGSVWVYANGVLLSQADYTAATSPTVVLGTARKLGDVITIISGITTNASVSTVVTRIGTVIDAASITPTGSASDQYNITALAQTANINAPNGTPFDGQKLTIRIKDNGVSRLLGWDTTSGGYRSGWNQGSSNTLSLPSATSAGKPTYVDFVYNAQDTYWDLVDVRTLQ